MKERQQLYYPDLAAMWSRTEYRNFLSGSLYVTVSLEVSRDLILVLVNSTERYYHLNGYEPRLMSFFGPNGADPKATASGKQSGNYKLDRVKLIQAKAAARKALSQGNVLPMTTAGDAGAAESSLDRQKQTSLSAQSAARALLYCSSAQA